MSAEDATLRRVRALLAKAEDPAASESEAEMYNGKAAELIAKYGIERALLAETAPGSDQQADRVVVLDPPYAVDKADLLWAVLRPLRCEGVRRVRHPAGRKQISMHVFGMASDVDRAELLFTSLLVQAALGLATARPGDPAESVAAFRRSWLHGFRHAVEQRLAAAERDARRRAEQDRARPAAGGTPGRSVALVLADRQALVGRAVAEAYPKLRASRHRSLSGSGAAQGHAAGQRADLGGSRLAGGRPRRAVSR